MVAATPATTAVPSGDDDPFAGIEV
jgi:hypothetical protein